MNISMTTTKDVGFLIGKRKKRIGALGEALVVKHLKNKGFSHTESNFLRRQGEIDVIMENSGKIHFIEVKTVSRESTLGGVPNGVTPRMPQNVIRETAIRKTVIHEANNYSPEENVSAWKMKKISRVVQIYLNVNNLENREWQFDVAVVFLDRNNKKALIKFIKDIPLNA